MNITLSFIPKDRPNRPGTVINPRFITIHDTGNSSSGAGADSHGKFLASTKEKVSWHYTVDEGEIVQHLPNTEEGYHTGTGTGNRESIGIEICENSDGNRKQAEENAARLTVKLLQDLKLPLKAVVQHNHWSGKDCPRVLRARPGGWSGFIRAVQDSMKPPAVETSFPAARAWVIEKGISDGSNPKDPVTREQVWEMLRRSLGGKS